MPIDRWTGPFSPEVRAQALAALEAGRVVSLPHLPFALAPEEARFLDPGTLDNSRKNISLDPATGRCHGSDYTGADLAALTAMLDRFGRQAEGLLRELFPAYAPALDRARTSFRPAEIQGREYSPRHDDRRLHVDAFPTRPMRGRRILRVFCNVAPDGVKREWQVGEPFPDFAASFLPRLRRPLPGQFWAMDLLGLTKGRRSAYDHAMLGLHDAGKLDAAYQAGAPRASLSFAPGTTWMCFTDSVLHAALAGRCALEQTFHLPVQAMANPEKSPLRVLERLSGSTLV
nr:Kdo hydroxylase family protein [Limobrevibacterium gyesilva]